MRRTSFAIAALIALAIAGCQNASPPATEASAAAPPPRGILVTGGNTGTVIFLQSDDAAHPTILCSPGTDVCPMCMSMTCRQGIMGFASRSEAGRRVAASTCYASCSVPILQPSPF